MALLALRSKSPLMAIIRFVATDARSRQAHASLHRLAVARVAVDLCMGAIKRKFRFPVMAEIPDLPVPRVVAGLAQNAAPALVLVIALVTRVAIALRVLEPGGSVALLAVSDDMAASKGELSAAMVKLGSLPVFGAVAVAALLSFLSLVDIVLLVAGEAVRRRMLEIGVPVAVLALGLNVLAKQRKLGLGVIERALLPVALRMAVTAGLPQGTFVLVVFLVTGVAGRGRLLEHGALVAGLALDVAMLAPEREACLAVIESRLCPVALSVAVGTGLGEGALVFVVLAVAGDTRRL